MCYTSKVIGPKAHNIIYINTINSLRSDVDADSTNARARGDNVSEHTINTLLVLATLIASVTFQARVNPPGGVWQENSPQNMDTHKPGKSILANNSSFYGIYIVCNTAAFSASSCTIGYLVEASGKFKVLVRVALFFMAATYSASVMAVMPNIRSRKNTCLFFFTLLVPFLVLFARDIWKKIKGSMG